MTRQWKLVRTEAVYKDPWSAVLRKNYQVDGGEPDETYVVIEKPAFALAVAIDKSNRVLLVRQYRHGTGRSYWALPGGFIDAGETPSGAAKRELFEETGYAAGCISHIAALDPMPGCLDSRGHIVLCEDLVYDPGTILDEEIDSIDLVPVETAVQRILSGDISEMQAVAGVLLALEFLRRREGK